MGWKTLYSVDESFFRDLYSRGEKWGDLTPYNVYVDSEEHYGAGVITGEPVRFQESPRIQHAVGKTRITIDFVFFCSADAHGEARIGIVFFKDGESAKDPQGADWHGVAYIIDSAPGSDIADKHQMVVEQENGRVVIRVDGEKMMEFQLELPLSSFAVDIDIPEASGTLYSGIGIVVTGVRAEYYDWMEDVVKQMTTMMYIMMWVTMIVTMISLVVKVFRGRR